MQARDIGVHAHVLPELTIEIALVEPTTRIPAPATCVDLGAGPADVISFRFAAADAAKRAGVVVPRLLKTSRGLHQSAAGDKNLFLKLLSALVTVTAAGTMARESATFEERTAAAESTNVQAAVKKLFSAARMFKFHKPSNRTAHATPAILHVILNSSSQIGHKGTGHALLTQWRATMLAAWQYVSGMQLGGEAAKSCVRNGV